MKRKPFQLLFAAVLLTALLSVAAVHPPDDRGTMRNLLYTDTSERPALDVPYVPTPHEVVEAMLGIAEVGERDVLYDLGCGDGRIVVSAAQKFGIRGIGVDLDPERIKESNENARNAKVTGRVQFFQRDLFTIDLSGASVVTLYLLPSVNLKLRPKLFRELRPGTRVVSHDFDMGNWQPDRKVTMENHTIYFWVVPANVSGVWRGDFPGGKGKGKYTLRIHQQFQKISGTLAVGEAKVPLSNMELKGNSLRFTIAQGIPGMSAPVGFDGFVEGNSIQGRMESGDKKRKWTAVRDGSTMVPLDIPDGQMQTALRRNDGIKAGGGE
ncbi:MAG: class I SAM-dependent methyltransferase [Alphaproteobacteria bacterium]|uniref:Class I SAM-dependent methyltransferase n=1 Tax=Candidatus Nitrobium versatile TaxID=2884831 RepID=A0A953M0W7_9BACT|nr:class I SAM-dependent methyltransferase [Candidatus Nitrobium versatile]